MMKRGLVGVAAFALLASAEGHAADRKVAMFGGVVGLYDSTYGYFGGVAALNGNIDADGPLFRLSGGIGQYSYETSPGIRHGVGQQQGDVMLGYHATIQTLHVSAFAGAEVQNHDNSDPNAVVRGTRAGAKGQLELFSKMNDRYLVFALGSYSTVYNAYYTKARFGYRIVDSAWFGPEASVHGNDRYDHGSTGAFIGYDLGFGEFSISGGYQWDLRLSAPGIRNSDGPYGMAGFSVKF
jgi:hypothetical protein